MKIKQVLSLFLTAIVIVSSLIMEPGCASIVPPTGGPRDSLPPLLLNVNPVDSTKSFTAKKIIFTFDEYVQLDNIQQNLLVSPTPKTNPIIQAKLKTITVQIKDTLEENTTYTLDFGKSLKDLNEGNIYRNFSYIFTTGKELDSMELSGKVYIAETGKTDSTLIAMLHRNFDDSAVIKDKPRYIARVNADGSFRFKNLAPGTYAVYAMKDEGARRYLSKDQFFAFSDSTVQSQSMKKDILLYAYKEKPKAAAPVTSSATKAGAKKPADGSDKFLKFQTSLANGQLDLLGSFSLTFTEPLLSFDSTQLRFTDEKFEPIAKYSIERDTSNKKVTLIHPWVENTTYNIIIDTALARDTLGRRIARNDTITFQTKKVSEYGLVRLRFMNLQVNRHPVLQFVQNDQVKFSHVFVNNQFNAKLFTPGEYDLRLVYDENQNGEWDSGEFFGKHIQPEKVQLIQRKLTVKANWDNEVDIQL